ncbi:unnamed protein product [Alopecurus aequalis]
MAAAAPGEDLSPLVAAILPPPAKRVKKDAVHETDGWSSLPADLDTFDVRFRPLRWIVLVEDLHTHGNKLVLLNTDTGRFLHRELPLLGDYYAVATTPGGFCVVADKSPPHAARVLNPLTASSSILPRQCHGRLHGRTDAVAYISVEMLGEVFVTHMLFLMIVQGLPFVFKIDADGVVQLKTIGNNAIFIGPYRRCMAVNAGNFPGVEANCIYYTEHLGSSTHICKCNIKDNKVERMSDVAEFIEQDKKFVLVADRPFTIVQILCSYTLNIPDSQLALQQIS